jgi:hypothetical protein
MSVAGNSSLWAVRRWSGLELFGAEQSMLCCYSTCPFKGFGEFWSVTDIEGDGVPASPFLATLVVPPGSQLDDIPTCEPAEHDSNELALAASPF